MRISTTPLTLQSIKTAAKRLKRHLSEMTHTQRLDVAAYVISGHKNFRDAKTASQNLLDKRPEPMSGLSSLSEIGRTLTHGQLNNEEPLFKRGDWYFYPETPFVVFEGEFSPYGLPLDHLSSSVRLLDFILQIQKKRWPKAAVKKGISPTYQVDEFISLIDDLCRYYLDNTIQGALSPGGQERTVDWDKAIKTKHAHEKYA